MIEHEGIIEKISGDRVTVRILQQSACSACHARGSCLAADTKVKEIDVIDKSGRFREQERVMVEGRESMGYRAVFWAFVVPLFILVGVLLLVSRVWNFSETQAAASSITALIPYYLVLYLLRVKMAKTFQFSIKKINSSAS